MEISLNRTDAEYYKEFLDSIKIKQGWVIIPQKLSLKLWFQFKDIEYDKMEKLK
jgi:hypothetical protein